MVAEIEEVVTHVVGETVAEIEEEEVVMMIHVVAGTLIAGIEVVVVVTRVAERGLEIEEEVVTGGVETEIVERRVHDLHTDKNYKALDVIKQHLWICDLEL